MPPTCTSCAWSHRWDIDNGAGWDCHHPEIDPPREVGLDPVSGPYSRPTGFVSCSAARSGRCGADGTLWQPGTWHIITHPKLWLKHGPRA